MNAESVPSSRHATIVWLPDDQRIRLTRSYVILVLPKCLLTWGYVKVDAAAFCLQHTPTGTARAPGRWRFDLVTPTSGMSLAKRSVYIQTVSESVSPGHGMDSCNTPT